MTRSVIELRTIASNRQAVINAIRNYDFEYAPAFTAATSTPGRWIDGSAVGGTEPTGSEYRWAFLVSSGGSASFDTSQKRNGSYSMKLNSDSSGQAFTVSTVIGTSKAILDRYAAPVLPSTSYTLTGYMKTVLNSGSNTGGGAQLVLSERSGTGSSVLETASTLVGDSQDWTLITLTVTTGASTRFIIPKLQFSSSSTVYNLDAWYDDLRLDLTAGTTRTVAGARTTV